MMVKKEFIDFVANDFWGGAEETFEIIQENGMLPDLEFLLEELFPDGIELIQLNDILRFEAEQLFEMLGIEYEE